MVCCYRVRDWSIIEQALHYRLNVLASGSDEAYGLMMKISHFASEPAAAASARM